MELSDILSLIASTSAKDWDHIGNPGILEVDENENLIARCHNNTAILKKNTDIKIVWGLTDNPDFREEWATIFPDPTTDSSFLDIFYEEKHMHRMTFITVDGGKVCIPKPDDSLQIKEWEYLLFQIVNEYDGTLDLFGEYLRRLGIKVK